MDELIENMLNELSPMQISDMLVNLNRFNLNKKEHIKKYNKIRKLHSEVLDSMGKYIVDGNHNEFFNDVSEYLHKEISKKSITLKWNDENDRTILTELLVYKNHPKLKSVTEVYLENNRFKKEDKIKMLNSMNNSYASLFKVLKVDRGNGYVFYQDVFSKRTFKIVDVSMSSSLIKAPKQDIYFYNRIITYDGISFGTGIHCMMSSNNKGLKQLLKENKLKNRSNFKKCIYLYDLSKKENYVVTKYNTRY